MTKNVLVQRAKERLWGKRQVGLPPEEIAESVRLGAEPEQKSSGREVSPS